MHKWGLGFAYWLVFLLVLEPGNLMGSGLSLVLLQQEGLRILGASVLGASVSPLIFAVVRRYPLTGPRWLSCAAVELLMSGALASVLIVVSCLLADRFLPSEHRPLAVALPQEFQANWSLLVFAIGGLLAIAHAVYIVKSVADRPVGPQYLARIPVKARGRVTVLALTDVDWIETQGNYLALHAGGATHLVRESLSGFEPRLNPKQFVRIHRRTIVAKDRVRMVRALGAGDAEVTLVDGTVLRLSRGFRDKLHLG